MALGIVPISGALACGEADFTRVEEANASSSALTSACEVGVSSTSEHRLPSINRTVTFEACQVLNGVPKFTARDKATGIPIDYEDAERQDAFAFHVSHAAILPAVADKLAADPSLEHEAHIWFRIDLTDQRPKEDTVGTESELAELVAREARTYSEAAKLIAKLDQVDGLQVISSAGGFGAYGAPIVVVRGNLAALMTAGTLPEVWQVMPVAPLSQLKPTSVDYFATTRDIWLDYAGYDGTGQVVADLEWVRPDSYLNLPGAPSGSCAPDAGYGTARMCHCAAGLRNAHARLTQGAVRSSALSFGGMADEVTILSANFAGGCVTNGPDAFSSAVNWAQVNGARVMYLVDAFGPDPFVDSFQTSREYLLDYMTMVSPYPFFAKSAGNGGEGAPAEGRLRNGVSVGGADESAGALRDSVDNWNSTSRLNPSGGSAFEVPHLAAVAVDVTSAGKELNSTEETGGTSLSTPQVAGIVAALHEMNPTLKSWPEVVVPGLLATADEDIDGTVLNLHDGVDDWDGAGLVNAALAGAVLGSGSKRNGSNPAATQGHDFGSMWASITPPFAEYLETYNAKVANGKVLRVAALLQSRPACPSNPGCAGNFAGCTAAAVCSANPYVMFALQVYDGTVLVGTSFNTSTSYQFVRISNASGVEKTYNIRLIPLSYNGLTNTSWGLAWTEADE